MSSGKANIFAGRSTCCNQLPILCSETRTCERLSYTTQEKRKGECMHGMKRKHVRKTQGDRRYDLTRELSTDLDQVQFGETLRCMVWLMSHVTVPDVHCGCSLDVPNTHVLHPRRGNSFGVSSLLYTTRYAGQAMSAQSLELGQLPTHHI